jgi:hypothetical protein
MPHVLVSLVIALILVALAYWIITKLPLPDPIPRIATVVIVVIFVIYLIYLLLPFAEGTGARLH